MSTIENWFRGLSWEKIWNDPHTEVRWALRILIFYSGYSWALTIFGYLSAMAALRGVPNYGGAISFAWIGWWPFIVAIDVLTVAAVTRRSFYGWLGFAVVAARLLGGALFPFGIAALWWLSRPAFRGLFEQEKEAGIYESPSL